MPTHPGHLRANAQERGLLLDGQLNPVSRESHTRTKPGPGLYKRKPLTAYSFQRRGRSFLHPPYPTTALREKKNGVMGRGEQEVRRGQSENSRDKQQNGDRSKGKSRTKKFLPPSRPPTLPPPTSELSPQTSIVLVPVSGPPMTAEANTVGNHCFLSASYQRR